MQTSWAALPPRPGSWKDCFSPDHQHTGTAGRQRPPAASGAVPGQWVLRPLLAQPSPPLPVALPFP